MSGTSDGDQVYVSCSTSYPTMVSCGWKANTADGDNDAYEGAWIETVNGVKRCYAQNGNGGAGLYARARCCDFTHLGDVDCVSTNFGEVSGDDNTISGECTGNYPYLTGCTLSSEWTNFDGAYFGVSEPSLFPVSSHYLHLPF